jgi:hypothetical protein
MGKPVCDALLTLAATRTVNDECHPEQGARAHRIELTVSTLPKRGTLGTFQNVSAKFLPLYVAEFEFWYDNQNDPDIFGAAVARY